MHLISDRIEVSDPLEAIEYCYRQNMTDGLPVVPPTENRVAQFLAHVGLSPGDQIAEVTERARVITAEKLAINAVMAECLPEYMPVDEPRHETDHAAAAVLSGAPKEVEHGVFLSRPETGIQ